MVSHYGDLALAKYEDSLIAAKALAARIDAFINAPSERNLTAAKSAWIAARVPYQQSEVYRFGNTAVDEWEGRVNAWPLDEGLIDYVSASVYGIENEDNPLFTANVVASAFLMIDGKSVDAAVIDPRLLRSLHEAGNNEANVATGYHAIEFLLWGQDLNGTLAGAGRRPASDYVTGTGCTNGNCDRRAAYLHAAAQLLINDLQDMVEAWMPGGAARWPLRKSSAGIAAILVGMGSLSYGELAGERMKLGLLLHDPEEEHDCFSDNTHNSHFYDGLGIENVYTGRYTRLDNTVIRGPSLSDLVRGQNAELDTEMLSRLGTTMVHLSVMKRSGDSGVKAYDQMLAEGDANGNAMVQSVIDALVEQTKTLEQIAVTLGMANLEFEASDSLDNPKAVFAQ